MVFGLVAMLATATKAQAQVDLAMCNLKGNVKKVVYSTGVLEVPIECETLTFNRNGGIATIDGMSRKEYFSSYKADAKGRLWKVFGFAENTYTYNAKGYLDKFVIREDGVVTAVYNFIYDAQGKLLKEVIAEYEDGQNGQRTTNLFQYSAGDIDSHGNWTKRKRKNADGSTQIETRTITYWN